MRFEEYIYLAFNKVEKEFATDDGYTTNNPAEAMWFLEESDMINEIKKMDSPNDFEVWKMLRHYGTVKENI